MGGCEGCEKIPQTDVSSAHSRGKLGESFHELVESLEGWDR